MNILSYLHFSRERGREWKCCSVPYVGNVLSWASHWSLPAEWTSAVKQGFLLQPFKYHLFCSAPQCKYPNDDSLNICLAGQCKYSSINSLKNCSASQFKYPNQYLFSTTMQLSGQSRFSFATFQISPILFSPTMQISQWWLSKHLSSRTMQIFQHQLSKELFSLTIQISQSIFVQHYNANIQAMTQSIFVQPDNACVWSSSKAAPARESSGQ